MSSTETKQKTKRGKFAYMYLALCIIDFGMDLLCFSEDCKILKAVVT